MGLILNHDDPSECFVLFPSAAPMLDIYSLSESPSWAGAHMQLIIKKQHLSILPLVTKLLADKALEEGEEYEYIPNEPLESKGARGPGKHSTPKRGTCCHYLGQTVKIPRAKGTSLNHVCYPDGEGKQTGSLFGPSPGCVLHPSDITEGGGPQEKYPQAVSF